MRNQVIEIQIPGAEEYLLLPDSDHTKTFGQAASLRSVRRKYPAPILLAEQDGRIFRLNEMIRRTGNTERNGSPKRDGSIRYLTREDRLGELAYRQSVLLLMTRAIRNLYGNNALLLVKSGQQGYCCEIRCTDQRRCPCTDPANLKIRSRLQMTPAELEHIHTTMDVFAEKNLKIEVRNLSQKKKHELFGPEGIGDEELLRRALRTRSGKLYELDGAFVLTRLPLAARTGALKDYELELAPGGFFLRFDK